MTQTKDQQAQEYAEKILNENSAFELDYFGLPQAWIDGYTACEQSMWRSVVEELPEIPNGKKMIRVLAWIGDEPLVCWYTCHGRFITTLAAKERYSYDCMAKVKVHLSSEREDVTEIVTHWMPIPPITDTKTEKKCGLATSNK